MQGVKLIWGDYLSITQKYRYRRFLPAFSLFISGVEVGWRREARQFEFYMLITSINVS